LDLGEHKKYPWKRRSLCCGVWWLMNAGVWLVIACYMMVEFDDSLAALGMAGATLLPCGRLVEKIVEVEVIKRHSF